MKFDLYLIPNTKVSSKWIRLKYKTQTIRLLKENREINIVTLVLAMISWV